MLTIYNASARIGYKVDRGANDISTTGRRQPVKRGKGDFAEGLVGRDRLLGPGIRCPGLLPEYRQRRC